MYIVHCTLTVELCLPGQIQMYYISATPSIGQGIQVWIGREYCIGLPGECHANGHQGLPACYVHQAAETDAVRWIEQFWGITDRSRHGFSSLAWRPWSLGFQQKLASMPVIDAQREQTHGLEHDITQGNHEGRLIVYHPQLSLPEDSLMESASCVCQRGRRRKNPRK